NHPSWTLFPLQPDGLVGNATFQCAHDGFFVRTDSLSSTEVTEQLVAIFNVDDHVREVVGSADRLCPAVAGSRPRSGLYTSSNFGGAIRKKEIPSAARCGNSRRS